MNKLGLSRAAQSHFQDYVMKINFQAQLANLFSRGLHEFSIFICPAETRLLQGAR